jgi:nucleotide-binding universal stress UspA family protein
MIERIVVGVDASPESLEAVRQADVLLDPDGKLVLLAAVDLSDTIHFQIAPTAIHAARRALEKAEQLDREAQAALARARDLVTRAAGVETVEVSGAPSACLLEAVATEHADLVAVGTHSLGRMAGITLGSVATRMLHRAPCSVLVARPPRSGSWSPRTIVVGIDGSTEADAALDEARRLEARFGARVTALKIDVGRASTGLVDAASGADLLVVGSRGVHGARALGSVSERVAHEASCSVLVVRAARAAARRVPG